MNNKNKLNLRADTAQVIHGVLAQGQSLRESLPKVQSKYSTQDSAWMHEMVLGVMRQLPLLHYWLNQLLDRPLRSKNKNIESLLLLGIYQLAFTRVPSHAAVAETVNAVHAMNGSQLKGLVNAVLRNYTRQDLANKVEQIEPEKRRQQLLSGLPDWLYGKLAKAYPDKLNSIVAQTAEKPPLWLRVNTVQVQVKQFQQALAEQQITIRTSDQHNKETLVLESQARVTELPGFDDGWFAVQDGAAQLAAKYLGPLPGERILDACAAPGGKTGHILEAQPALAEVIALDSDQSRLARVQENLTRLQHQVTLFCGDGTQPNDWWDGRLFDRILLDAPCSATGVIRRHPDIKWLRRPDDIKALVLLQREILEAMWTLLKPGGVLLYATCSVLPEENTKQVNGFLQDHADAEAMALAEDYSESERQILPGENGMDGFFYAKIRKASS